MLGALAKLFKNRDRLSELSRQRDRHVFIRTLLDSDVTLFAALRSEGLDAANYSQEDLLAEIERAAKDLNERDGFEPFVYPSGNCRCLPFFSTADHAQTFCGEYSKERNRIFPFQTLEIRGSVLAKLLPGCDRLVLNGKTADEYVLTEADLELLRQSG